MRKHFITQNRIGDLRRIQQIHLQQSRLQPRMLWLVVFESVEQKASRLLNHVLRHENVYHSFEINKRARLVIDELSGEFRALVGVGSDNVLQDRRIVGAVADLFRVEQNLVKLTELGKARDGLV